MIEAEKRLVIKIVFYGANFEISELFSLIWDKSPIATTIVMIFYVLTCEYISDSIALYHSGNILLGVYD